ncbi:MULTISPECIES: hypothetical protein [unclassified Mesorhizobium]|uniref:hypothetical protein n=1 Tax=unclassified Mesorhizobium TaxID=325217 RepID=UPI000FCA7E06|nr:MULTISPECIES: hypothetical protein [unclassified Mesorhizobium]TGP24174.1 hypothetical protein EN874_010780 [Mesorhizobium sp. M1D.F.Ca.ET.231.01.1.1]TGP35239.1 hypothetical protein EN877_11315 [Mesorhizobium sp. M1D.F.Ca.ET.234.01.1.1]TGS49261.1 hypothetical protein EN827_11310 [Mesorhizobium sp. M1D.F.Ca.ET.184.01.1.1]TGS63459.1 hypothetical protein EN826_011310 [Mesorhizobium sp. M1D.F.Ca.ET.183.01.1.1]
MSGRTEGGAGAVGRQPSRLALATAFTLLVPTLAFAHASDRGHVLLLPTGYYIAGGAFAVAASFLVLVLLPPAVLDNFWRRRFSLFPFGDAPRTIVSLLSFAGFVLLIAAGLLGSRDPLSNPLPLVIWTLLWAGFTLLQGVFGDLWSWLNPWYGPWRVVSLLVGKSGSETPQRLPSRLGLWPAFALFLAFAWFELIDPAPDDPSRLALAAGLYWLFSAVAMLAFGYEDWSRRGEFLTIFFSMVARFAPFQREQGRLGLGWPGSKLLAASPLPASGTAFLLLALSSVSFDGLSKTFFWLGLFGINPLEFPGRTALIGIGTSGLVLTFVLLAAIFALAVFLGQRLAGGGHSFGEASGLLVWSIVPIALAYHIAHYLAALLVDGQYALAALSDPFALGWNLFGTADMVVEAGVVAGAGSAWWLWNCQAGVIIAGHVLAVLIAHGLAWRLHPQPSRAALSQLPLTLLMIAYTIFGLWLLATPTAG